MANWNDILNEINSDNHLDNVRRKYLRELSDYTGRNTIAYYSAFLERQVTNVDINDSDMNGFMNAVHGLDYSKGLDLILHTPGGNPAAAESIITYLRTVFHNDLRIIVPHMAMSAGTLMACAAKEIVMGKHSFLGPVDPQFNGIPAFSIVDEYKEAKDDLAKNPANLGFWKLRLEKFPPAYIKLAADAIALSDTLMDNWLKTGMFEDVKDQVGTDVLVEKIKNSLNEHTNSKVHNRHFSKDECLKFGLKIKALESDPTLQDKVLSVHHAYTHTITMASVAKLVENHNGKALISMVKAK